MKSRHGAGNPGREGTQPLTFPLLLRQAKRGGESRPFPFNKHAPYNDFNPKKQIR